MYGQIPRRMPIGEDPDARFAVVVTERALRAALRVGPCVRELLRIEVSGAARPRHVQCRLGHSSPSRGDPVPRDASEAGHRGGDPRGDCAPAAASAGAVASGAACERDARNPTRPPGSSLRSSSPSRTSLPRVVATVGRAMPVAEATSPADAPGRSSIAALIRRRFSPRGARDDVRRDVRRGPDFARARCCPDSAAEPSATSAASKRRLSS